MTGGDLRTGRTGSRIPLQILAGYCQTGDTPNRDLWLEYARVTARWRRYVGGAARSPETRRTATTMTANATAIQKSDLRGKPGEPGGSGSAPADLSALVR